MYLPSRDLTYKDSPVYINIHSLAISKSFVAHRSENIDEFGSDRAHRRPTIVDHRSFGYDTHNPSAHDTNSKGKLFEAARTRSRAELPDQHPGPQSMGKCRQTAAAELDDVGARAFMEHHNGTCTPCIFWMHWCCNKGGSCPNCHNEHSKQRIKQVRISKKSRQQLNDFAARPSIVVPGMRGDASDQAQATA